MPVYFLWGDEDYLIEKAQNKIKHDVLGDDINPMNYKTSDNPPYPEFLELLNTQGMLFGSCVISIKAQKYFLEMKSKEKLDEKQSSAIAQALSNVSDMVHIILLCPIPRGEKKKPDSRKKIYKELLKVTTPQEFSNIRSYETDRLIPHIKTILKEEGLSMEVSDIIYLIQTTSTYLRDIANTIEKLKLTIYPETKITKKHIKEISTTYNDVFKIIDYIIEKKYPLALNRISNILLKEHYSMSLALFQTSLTNLLKTKVFSSSMNAYDISLKLNIPKFIVQTNLEKLKNTDTEDLIRLKINLENIQYQLQSGMLNDVICAYEKAFLEEMC